MIFALAGLRASDYYPDDEDVLGGRHSAACSAFSLRPTNLLRRVGGLCFGVDVSIPVIV